MSDAPLMLSVSGMRGLVGRSLTPAVACEFAAAWGTCLKQHVAVDKPKVVIGRDSRPSGEAIELAAAAGLMAVGCDVIDLGIAATPTVALMVDHARAHGGLVATASHNPIDWNGLKPITPEAAAPPPEFANRLIERFNQRAFDYVCPEAHGSMQRDASASQVHVDRVLRHVDGETIRGRGLKVVIDSVNGAGGEAARMLCEALGVETIHLNAEPTGRFPHSPEPLRDHLTDLCHAVAEHQADAGFAQDPDADRLAIVDGAGRYIGEEYSLALCARQVIEHHARGPAVANLSTSRMVDDVAAAAGTDVHRSPVGEANVAAMMRNRHAVVGGEGNGGVIWPPIVYVRDSIATMALVLEMMAGRDAGVADLVAELPAYAIVKDKLEIAPGMADRVIDALAEAFEGHRLDRQDGIRIDTDAGWLHVRPSNTEPILRIIAEADDEADARKLIEAARQHVHQ